MRRLRLNRIPAAPMTIILAGIIGILGGYGAILFLFIIGTVRHLTVDQVLLQASEHSWWLILLCLLPGLGLVVVAWFTRRFAPEAEGHGVPEVITAVARRDGVIRPRVSLVKILASGICIGTGGSVGREGPIVQIGSSLGSVAGQFFGLSPRHIKVLVAAGAAAGISATFNAPLAGVIFASEIILGSFAVESLTPIVVASVLADVVQQHYGEHRLSAAFPQLEFGFRGAWQQLPSYVLLGLICGLAAVGFTKLLYAVEDFGKSRLPRWWMRALVFGALVGVVGVVFRGPPPVQSREAMARHEDEEEPVTPYLFGVGYHAVDHALHLTMDDKMSAASEERVLGGEDRIVTLSPEDAVAELWWLLPLALFKPLLTSLSLGGGGSGGIFAPSLFIGATLGASFGLLCNIFVPEFSANPGAYAIVGMGAVVAGTTHGILSAVLIVYEMTNTYEIILPIMATAGLASVVAYFIEPESIYTLKLSRRGESIARGHDMHRLEHIMVRDVMIRSFPTVRNTDAGDEIIRVARANSHIDCLPVLNDEGQLTGVIRSEDLHRVIDTDIPAYLLRAEDIALMSPLAVSPDENLLEALRDFGTRDVEMLPVESGKGANRKLIGILHRSDVMRRYRLEMLRRRG
jgi:CIC family chloride channel protein